MRSLIALIALIALPVLRFDPAKGPPMTSTTLARPSALRRHLARSVRAVLTRVGDRERGDVPGWVLITLMTAGLVVAIWAVAGPALTEMFDSALKSVKGP